MIDWPPYTTRAHRAKNRVGAKSRPRTRVYRIRSLGSRAASGFQRFGRKSGGSSTCCGKGGAFSEIALGGGLATHEAAGGHLLAKHVGQTEAQLLERLAQEPGITGSSSFYNRATAESVVSRTLAAKQAEIGAWLCGNKPQLKLKYSLPENVGRTVSKGVTGAVDSANLRLILRLDSSMPNGYRVHTG